MTTLCRKIPSASWSCSHPHQDNGVAHSLLHVLVCTTSSCVYRSEAAVGHQTTELPRTVWLTATRRRDTTPRQVEPQSINNHRSRRPSEPPTVPPSRRSFFFSKWKICSLDSWLPWSGDSITTTLRFDPCCWALGSSLCYPSDSYPSRMRHLLPFRHCSPFKMRKRESLQTTRVCGYI